MLELVGSIHIYAFTKILLILLKILSAFTQLNNAKVSSRVDVTNIQPTTAISLYPLLALEGEPLKIVTHF